MVYEDIYDAKAAGAHTAGRLQASSAVRLSLRALLSEAWLLPAPPLASHALAADHLSGFNVSNRYLIVLFFSGKRQTAKVELQKQEAEIAELKKRHGV